MLILIGWDWPAYIYYPRLAAIQPQDGAWRTSLLDLPSYPTPETTGTACFTYGACAYPRPSHVHACDHRSRGVEARTPLAPRRDAEGGARGLGMAWGINNGILPASHYAPVVAKAWAWLSTVAMQPNGTVRARGDDGTWHAE